MIYLFFIFLFCLALFVFVPFRIVILHPLNTLYYSFLDTYHYFKYHKYDICPFPGTLTCYSAHFGGGKTLSCAEYVTRLYKRYNNKRIYDPKRGWVIQKIHILTNVDFIGLPYEKLDSLAQVVSCAEHNSSIDSQFHTSTVTLVFLDEASVTMNSRQFKTNIDPLFLNSLLCCRHYKIGMIYTSQKFKLTDALMRSVTQKVCWCKKYWRLLVQYYYPADSVEIASDISLIKPYKRIGIFITDEIYGSYDTLAVVGTLKKAVESGDMLSESEILNLRDFSGPDNDSILRPSGTFRRLKKRSS